MTRRAVPARRVDALGLSALGGASLLLVALAARWVTGGGAALLVALLVALAAATPTVILRAGADVRRRLLPYLLLAPGTLWLALFYWAPVFTLLRSSLSERESRFSVVYELTWDLVHYREAFTAFGPQFGRAFLYGGAAALLALAIGYPLAYFIAFRGGRFKNLLLGLVVVPLFTSYLIRTIAWTSILADEGPVLGALEALHLLGVLELLRIAEDGRLLNTAAAVVGGLTYNFLPFTTLPVYVALERIDVRLLDAAQDLYSSRTAAFRKVVLPLSLPGVFAGTLLSFIPAAGDFVNAQFLGNPNTTMIGNSIQDQFLRQNDHPLASAMSFVLMLAITALVVVYGRFFDTRDLA